jgi:hypothetical protein
VLYPRAPVCERVPATWKHQSDARDLAAKAAERRASAASFSVNCCFSFTTLSRLSYLHSRWLPRCASAVTSVQKLSRIVLICRERTKAIATLPRSALDRVGGGIEPFQNLSNERTV